MDAARSNVAFVVGLALTAMACGSGGTKSSTDGGTDAAGEASCAPGDAGRKANGQSCGCAGECASGFCADGVCCNVACSDTCKSCALAPSMGTCSFVARGEVPARAGECPKTEASTCGLDGTCNGAGACRQHAAGTVCRAGTCSGATVSGGSVCDGNGRCKVAPETLCAPYGCDASKNACVATCASDSDCAGTKCVAGSCGPKRNGAVCAKNQECASGFCTDGVCCNVACSGACVACNLVGRSGTCWPIDSGAKDPRHICKDKGAAACGQTGACDGFGGCSLYKAETICAPPSCAGARLNTAGTCDGKGACRAPGVQNCWPYLCGVGACATSCETDDDCQPGHACVAGSCGLKNVGQTCAGAGECASGFCVDGVCCDGACGGSCTTCALPSAMGRCSPVPAGAADPRGLCSDKGAASCGSNGMCDGFGGCQKYKAGTECAAERCEGNVYTASSACDGAGQCVAPPSLPCAPFACNGSRCYTSCQDGGNCVAPNTCANQSCGKKPTGAFCSNADECGSGFCAQGVCCATACASTCRSCALSGTMGQCSDVATGSPDPTGTCLAEAPSMCGTNGMCEAGACQKYAQGTPCGGASCPAGGTTYTPASSCDGAGACVTPPSTSCAPYKCGASSCKATCTADADCVAPSVCNAGSCGLKGPGATCSDGTECTTGVCAQGVCCRTACSGTCMSCAGATTAGTCAPVPVNGADPTGACKDQGAASCGQTGACDGAGACLLYAAGTTCAAAGCMGSGTQLLARTCDGAGACQAAATLACAPYACSGTACSTTCTSDSQCAAGDICDMSTNLCGDKKRLGQACSSSDECLTGNFCVDGVCCGTSSCGTCLACNVAGRAGTCSAVSAGAAEPHARCVPAPPCGSTGTCDGAGQCLNAPTTTSCGQPTCSGSTATQMGFCNGAGACSQLSLGCSPYLCGTDACRTSCAADGDCVAGSSCVSGSCTSAP